MDDPFDALSPPPARVRPETRAWGRVAELLARTRDRRRSRGDPFAVRMLVGVAIMVFLGLGAWWLSQGRAQPVELPRAEAASATAAAPGVSTVVSSTEVVKVVPPAQEVVVHVAGQVHRPGLYSVNAGGRLADAVNAAGGPTAQADLDRVNLAEPLTDGARAYIPAVGQAEAPGTVPQGVPESGGPVSGQADPDPAGADELVNLNSADAGALEALPGIGPVTAEAIVAHRDEAGPFSQVEDLLEVRGIGDAKVEGLADLVTV